MTGKFTEKDPQRCQHYARFMSHLTLAEANVVYWMLFVIVLLLMCFSSLQHHKSLALGNIPSPSTKIKLRIRRQRVHMLSIVSLCLCLSITATIFECFAAFNIEYCDGEDLMQLYWGFWSILQVGSNIAIMGVMLQFWIVLGDHETPSWAVALGTPVLVFAALGFVLRAIGKQTWERCRGKRVIEGEGETDEEEGRGSEDGERDGDETDVEKYDSRTDRERNMSQAPTIVPPSREGPTARSEGFWSRDLHYLLNSVVNEQRHEQRHGHGHGHGRR